MKPEELYEQFRKQGYPVAQNYRKRARKIVEFTLLGVKMFAGPERWKDPTEAQMEAFVDELPGILNWAAKNTGKPKYSNLPLTEEQMSEIEKNIEGTEVILCII